MLKGREILSLPVVTLHDRIQLGEIKDIIYDPDQSIIIGYLVEPCGWIRDGRGFLHTDLVKLEEDCMVVADESVVRPLSSMPDLKAVVNSHKDIRGYRVEHNDGRQIGVVQDVVLEGDTGQITGYEISDGVIQDLLDGRVTLPNTGLKIDSEKVIAREGLITDNAKGEPL